MTGHLDPSGRLAMVDVGTKAETTRVAVAGCRVRLSSEALQSIRDTAVAKGDVLAVAQVAAVQAAKKTPELIPGCHPLRITSVTVDFEFSGDGLGITTEVTGTDRTGFEMEALTAAAVAALTVYDMCKAIDPGMVIIDLRLVSKSGGTSSRAISLDGVKAAVVTVSDRASSGNREDLSGPAAAQWLAERGACDVVVEVIPDDRATIADKLRSLAADCDLVVTTGGTGVGPRDITPEATLDVADRVVVGLAESIRSQSIRFTPHGMLSRGVAVISVACLIVNLPGSPKAVSESLDAIAPALTHALELLRGGDPHPN